MPETCQSSGQPHRGRLHSGQDPVGRRRGCGPWKLGRDKGTSRPAALISPRPSPAPGSAEQHSVHQEPWADGDAGETLTLTPLGT